MALCGRRWPGGAVVLLFFISVFGPQRDVRAEPEAASLGSDRDGAISEWILFISDGALDSFVDTQARIIRAADPASRIRVFHHSVEGRRALEASLGSTDPRARNDVRFVRTSEEIPYWPRDMFAVGRHVDGSSAFYLPAANHFVDLAVGIKSTGAALLLSIVELAGIDAIRTEFLFEGGAVVSDADRVFLSPAILQKTLLSGLGESLEAILGEIEKLFGRTTLMLDSSLLALPDHIDLFLTPIGEGRMVLGDPVLGRRLLRSLGAGAKADFRKKLSEVAKRAGDLAGAEKVLRPEFISDLLRGNGDAEFLVAFRRVETQLRNLGYEVLRVPFLWCPDVPAAERLTISYNNVVLEDRGTSRTVYLPFYGLGAVDKAAMAVWNAAGFRVRPIPCLGPAYFGGGVRCLTQVLRR